MNPCALNGPWIVYVAPLDVSWLPPCLAAVGWLARVQLDARRGGYRLRLLNAPPPLRDLLALVGLSELLL
jgi:hypothetical protein